MKWNSLLASNVKLPEDLKDIVFITYNDKLMVLTRFEERYIQKYKLRAWIKLPKYKI